jgi:hypothetical protein
MLYAVNLQPVAHVWGGGGDGMQKTLVTVTYEPEVSDFHGHEDQVAVMMC